MIYLDNAATVRVFEKAWDEMSVYLREQFYNPSALYGASASVKQALESARQTIASKLNASGDEVIFTSCATESNNWVLNCGRKYKKGNIVTTMGEHPAVYETARALVSKGVDVRFAELSSSGQVDVDDLFKKIDGETALVSIIHASNETGAINDLGSIVPKIRSCAPRALVHSDGVQAFCKIDTNMRSLGLDFYSLSAHKVGGSKGVGALYINKSLNIAPFILGGGQERGLRSGTENVAGILGFAKAVEIYSQKSKTTNISQMYAHMIEGLKGISSLIINGASDSCTQYIISASIPGIRSEILQHMLSDEGILIGLGSACSAKSRQNRVLSSMGRSGKEIEGSIRISFSVENTLEEIESATKKIVEKVNELRKRMGS